ncbi:ankyrin repeat-containing domain protein [Dactylonectria macrodidyma]|uniref:Ankyrin repeat-containing domain protein n=1 Tax=Dactylonectria macrodidyma TaxID=307937 RepID=A0A9P9EEA9_9HYPO|nr:ankyrin repeat-containing domain protein [Dactylonectria macrodidyma]
MSRASKIPTIEWERHKEEISRCYQDMKLSDLAKHMAESHKFFATEKQYVRKLGDWKVKKYSNKQAWEQAYLQVHKRKREDKTSEIVMNGKVIKSKRMKRELTRYSLPWSKHGSLLNDPSQEQPNAIPGDLVVRTPPSNQSPSITFNSLPWFLFQDSLQDTFFPIAARNPGLKFPSILASQVDLAEGEVALSDQVGSVSQLLQLSSLIPDMDVISRHNRLQKAANANTFVKVFQSAIYLASNNLLQDNHIKSLLKWVSKIQGTRVLDHILSIGGLTVEIFASRLLPEAVRLRDITLVHSILKTGVDPNTRYAKSFPKDETESALDIAIEAHDSELVKLLINNGADVNDEFASVTPLYLAVERLSMTSGDVSVVKLLIDAGAAINAESPQPRNPEFPVRADITHGFPLHRAVHSGYLVAVQLLLEAGANVNALSAEFGSVLQIATGNKNLEMVSFLLNAKVNANLAAKEGSNSLEEVRARGVYIFEKECELFLTPIQLAADVENIEIAHILLNAGADVNGIFIHPPNFNKKSEYDIIADLLVRPHCIYEYDWGMRSYGTALHQAALNGNFEMCRFLLNSGAKVDALDCTGSTPLHAACSRSLHGFLSNYSVAQLLLSNGADPNARTKSGYGDTTLQVAILSGQSDLVDLLLDWGADVNAHPSFAGGRTALQAAATRGDVELFERILMRGGDIHAEVAEFDGVTCVQAAALSENLRLITRLMELGADSNDLMSEEGFAALQLAVEENDTSVVQKLIDAGTFIFQGKLQQPLLSTAIQHNSNLDIFTMILEVEGPDPPGYPTPLCIAIKKQSFDMAYQLLSAGADVNKLSSHDLGRYLSPLHCAIWAANNNMTRARYSRGVDAKQALICEHTPLSRTPDCIFCGIDFVQALIKYGVDVNESCSSGIVHDYSSYKMYGSITQAVSEHSYSEALVRVLLDAGANVNLPSTDDTPLQRAILKQNSTLVDLFLTMGADINAPAAWENGKTALQAAVYIHDIDLVRDLVSRGADINGSPAREGGATALQLAVAERNLLITMFLLEQGANINAAAVGKFGRTALQAAVEHEDVSLVRELVSRGAEVNGLPSSDGGATALQLAAIKGNLPIAVFLLEQGADINASPALADGRTALEGAAEHGRLDMVHFLLANDDNDGTIKDRCQAAAEFAEKNGHHIIARVLRSR